ncbi:MAG: flagellar hook-length control protein FliK [Treponema sp.]|nr:flagellar hook-length control protein FliK [Treponema sp.]
MIQLSHLIQNAETPPPELPRKAGAEGLEKAEKNDDPGVFAQLLAGLLRNVHNPQKAGETGEPGKTGEAGSGAAGAVRARGLSGISGGRERLPGAEIMPEEAVEPGPEGGISPGKRRGPKKAPGPDRIGAAGNEKAARPVPGGETIRAKQEGTGEDAPGDLEKAGEDSPSGTAAQTRSLRNSDAPAPPEGAAGPAGAGDAALAEGLPLAGAVPETSPYPPGDEPGKRPEAEAKETGTAGKTGGGRLSVSPEAAGTGASSPAKAGERRSGGDAEPEGGEAGRTRNRRKERFSPEIRDLRSAVQAEKTVSGAAPPLEGGHENRSGTVPETELLVELRSAGAKTPAEIGAEREARPAATFHEMLARELHQNLNGDIVRHASILLRDGGEGLIRLSLKPESLGNVKIRLEMAENKIAGHIIVESDDAFRAFEREIRSLEQAFRDSGFDGANLEMSFARDDGQYGNREGAAPFFEESPAVFRAAAYAGEGPARGIGPAGGPYGGDPGRINMLV